MSKFREAYTALTPSSPRPDVSAVLQSMIDARPFQIDDANRKELIQTIINDLTSLTKGASTSSKCRLNPKDSAQALLAVKSMGKNPAGSEIVAIPSNLVALLAIFNHFKDDADASNETLRCIANALLLIEPARATFVKKDVGGSEVIIDLLEKTTSPERIFLASRITFLTTVSMLFAADYIRSLVENKPVGHHSNIIEIIGNKLDILTTSILASEKMARDAMSELLKMSFNLLLHYPKIVDSSSGSEPKVMGDCWSDRLDGILPPLLRLFNCLPPTFPAPLAAPMTHVIHTLLTVPVTPSLKSKWLPSITNAGSPRAPSKSFSPTSSPAPESPPISRSDSPPAKEVKESRPGAFDRAISRLSASRKSSRASSPQQSASDTLLRAYDLLDITLSHYLPNAIDPDDVSIRKKCQTESDSTLDDLVCPLVLLITRLCSAEESARRRMREWIIPDDLDRTSPLEGRADLLGRCLRLLASVHHTRLKDSIGEMLYAICDSDPSTLASYVGYGNVAGFLFNKGVMSAPPASGASGAPATAADGTPINPITGIAQKSAPSEPEMSDEEKEREAEKLFVLFDRLERSGAIPASQNPIRKAISEGKGPAY